MPVFLLLFLTLQNISTKRSPNATKLSGYFFSSIKRPWKLREHEGVAHSAPGRVRGLGRFLVHSGAYKPLFQLRLYKYSKIRKPTGESTNYFFCRRRLQNHEIPSHLEAFSSTLPEGDSITEGDLHHRCCPPMMRE